MDSADERIIKGIRFDKMNIPKNLTLFCIPMTAMTRDVFCVYQEYFMVSNAAQMILDECTKRGSNLHDLADYAAIQINDASDHGDSGIDPSS